MTDKSQTTLDLVDRLRGKIVIPVNDGAGLLDGKDTFTRQFPTVPIQLEAAEEIERLREALKYVKKACLCTRGTKGFDYGQKHKYMGEAGIGKRWLTPTDRARDALKEPW